MLFFFQDGKDCNTWVVGRFLSKKEQAIAPSGTIFHQFVVPMLEETRPDCSYTLLPGRTSWPLVCCSLNLSFCHLWANFSRGLRDMATKQIASTKFFPHSLLINASALSLTKHALFLDCSFQASFGSQGIQELRNDDGKGMCARLPCWGPRPRPRGMGLSRGCFPVPTTLLFATQICLNNMKAALLPLAVSNLSL